MIIAFSDFVSYFIHPFGENGFISFGVQVEAGGFYTEGIESMKSKIFQISLTFE